MNNKLAIKSLALVDGEVELLTLGAGKTSPLADIIVLALGTGFTPKSIVVPVVGQVTSHTLLTVPEWRCWWAVPITIAIVAIAIVVAIVVVSTVIAIVVVSTVVVIEVRVQNTSVVWEIKDLIVFTGHALLIINIVVLSGWAGFTGQSIMIPVIGKIAVHTLLSIPERVGAVNNDIGRTISISISRTIAVSIVVVSIVAVSIVVVVSTGADTEIQVEIEDISLRTGQAFSLIDIIMLVVGTSLTCKGIIVPVIGQETSNTFVAIPERFASVTLGGGSISWAIVSRCVVVSWSVVVATFALFGHSVEGESWRTWETQVLIFIPMGVLRATHTLVIAIAPETSLRAVLVNLLDTSA